MAGSIEQAGGDVPLPHPTAAPPPASPARGGMNYALLDVTLSHKHWWPTLTVLRCPMLE